MVKTPNVRHSKTRKEPVTIDLEASRLPSDDITTPETEASPEPDAETRETAESPLLAEASEAALDETAKDAENAPKGASAADFLESQPAQPGTSSTDLPPAADEPSTQASEEATPAYGRRNTSDQTSGLNDGAAKTPPPPPSPRRAGISAIAAGIIGGVVTLVGAGALQYGGVLPSPGGGSDAAAVESLRTQIAGLQTEIGALKSGTDASAVGQTVADLQARVDTLVAGLDTVRQAVESGGAGENAGLAALDSKVAELQAEIAKLGQGGSAQPVDLAPLNDRLTSLEAGIKSAADAAAAVDPRLTALERSVAALTSKLDAQDNQPKIALSIAASALKAAIDRGQSFAAELDTLAAISPNLPQLPALRANAKAGVAARDDLDAGMDDAAKAMIAANEPADANASYVDQLWESAASLVTVRPIGAVAGEGVPETVARMEAALKTGDLAKTLAEYDSLPEPAKAAGAAFAGKIKTRLDVETLVDQAIAEAMKSV